ncbi:MAG: carboxymuconolactone decarboxylase family protein [Acidimicrobiales bacterium]
MPVIEPIPWDDLPPESRLMIEEGQASGMYSTPVPLQVMAYSSAALRSMHDAYRATFRRGVLEPRLVELLRLRSAEAGGCAPCMASRKDDSVTEDDVACLIDPDPDRFTPREVAALRFFDMLAFDHMSINADTYRSLHVMFTTAEIVELAYLCANSVGTHRFLHTLAFASDEPATIDYRPEEVDSGRSTIAATA